MSGSMSRDKGQWAEREVVKLLQPVVNRVYAEFGKTPPELGRNLAQAHKGGCDIFGLEWISLEVKHHETEQLTQWWEQTKKQASPAQVPVLLHRKNNARWKCRMFGALPTGGPLQIRTPVDIGLEAFLLWFEHRLKHELSKGPGSLV